MSDALIYAERMLNPFHGVVNVVETPGADAVSRDGLTWSLYVHGDREPLAEASWAEVRTPDIRFGTWNATDGLRRAPVRSTTDYPNVERLGLHLLSAVERHIPLLPFPLADRHELWLLDARTGLPLALLDSAREAPRPGSGPPPRWNPGELCRRTFRPESPGTLPGPDAGGAGDALARLVNAAAGRPAAAQWFRREPDGSGNGGGGLQLDQRLTGRRLSPDAFPELLLRPHWPERGEQELVREFLDWQAPWLLLLQSLGRDARAGLEQVAWRQADRVADQHRLYPTVTDHDRLRATLVEAKLRGSVCTRPAADDSLSPFYIEL